MIAGLITTLSLALFAQAGDGWVWSYYDGDGSVVLAREIPDTTRLSAVLDCEPGSGLVRLTLYGPRRRPDFINVSAGDVSADAERVDSDGLAVRMQMDHPVLQAFGEGQALTLTAGDEVASAHPVPARLMSRFRAACSGHSVP